MTNIKNISLPKRYKFYDAKAENNICKYFNIEKGIEVYSGGIEGWYWSYADFIIVKIESFFYVVRDLSMEYEG